MKDINIKHGIRHGFHELFGEKQEMERDTELPDLGGCRKQSTHEEKWPFPEG